MAMRIRQPLKDAWPNERGDAKKVIDLSLI